MKGLIYIFWLFISVSSFAQEYSKFKVGLGLGGVSINKAGGPAFSFEPAYRLSDRFTIGFKLEGIIVLGATNTPTTMGSQSINSQYYFSTSAVRSFIGAGVGIYNMTDGRLSTIPENHSNYEKNKIGFYPRVGFDYGHFTFAVEYNFMTPVKVVNNSIFLGTNNSWVTYVDVNYFAARISLSIGGGKKKKP